LKVLIGLENVHATADPTYYCTENTSKTHQIMGVSTPKSFLYTTGELPWDHLVHIAYERAKSTTAVVDSRSDTRPQRQPMIDMDANLVGFNFIGTVVQCMECSLWLLLLQRQGLM